MAYISKIKPNGAQGTEYDLKDATARSAIENTNRNIQSSITPAKAAVVTVTDAAPINAEDITVDITPQQDLHGYDSPWVGGAGKNKLQVTATTTTKSGVTFTVKEDGTIVVTGTKSSSPDVRIWFDIAVNISFSSDVILNGCPSDGGNTTYKLAGFVGYTGTGDYNDVGNGVTIPANTMLKTLSIGIAQQGNISLVFKPMIRLATVSDATFAPYSNICPIERWTGAELDRVGVNQWDEDVRFGYYDNAGEFISNPYTLANSNSIKVAPNTTYYFALNPRYVNGVKLIFRDINKNYITYDTSRGGVFTIPNNCYYMDFSTYGVIEITTYNNDISINYPSTDTSYHPYQGQQYTADFGETVYGGKWHVTEGGTDKTHANIANYNGETINEPWLSSMDEYSPGATPTTGAQVVYPLTTPTTISTPKQNVPMLKGINTVFADCGDTQLKYQPDNVVGELKGEIEDNIIYEDFKWTTESSQSYSAGTPGTYGTSSWRDVKKEGYDVIGVTFVENRRFGDCILTLDYIPSTGHVEVIIFRATSSAVTIADEDIEYRVAYKKRT